MPSPSKRRLHYTIRGISPDLDRALRQRAKDSNKSLNQVVLDEMAQAIIGLPAHADFLDLVGKWQADPRFDEVIASQRKIDQSKWK